jgi:hypothetical protein
MAIESWMNPDEVPDLAAHATAMVDAALVGTDLSGDVFWAAVRKGYNTPYNDPPRKKAAAIPAGIVSGDMIPGEIIAAEIIPVVPAVDVPPVVAPVVAAAEIRVV